MVSEGRAILTPAGSCICSARSSAPHRNPWALGIVVVGVALRDLLAVVAHSPSEGDLADKVGEAERRTESGILQRVSRLVAQHVVVSPVRGAAIDIAWSHENKVSGVEGASVADQPAGHDERPGLPIEAELIDV